MTQDEQNKIEELKALDAKATVGPWSVSDTSIITDEYCIAVVDDNGEHSVGLKEAIEGNAQLIAAYRNHALPLLESLQAEIEQKDREIERLKNFEFMHQSLSK